MSTEVKPRHKRLAVVDARGSRAVSTPPADRPNKHLLLPPTIPSSRHSSPGIDRLLSNGRRYAEELIPRRLTVSPIPKLRDRDRTRKRLTQYQSVDHAAGLLRSAKNVVILSGAGISTSLDIPDFRSSTGFYSTLPPSLGVSKPEEFFSLDFFRLQSEAFWDNVKPLLPRYARGKNGTYIDLVPNKSTTGSESTLKPQYSATHAFLALLQAKKKLLTNYTQNVDGLEFAAGVKASKIIQCHGTWDTATCISCGKTIPAKKYLPIVYEAGYPRCKCGGSDVQTISPAKRRPRKRKRAVYEGDSDHSSDDGATVPRGLFKPDITFFGEPISEAYAPRLAADKANIDLLIIIGTSLKVRPIKTMVVDFPPAVPQIWINKDRFSGTNSDMPGVQVDIELLGECDVVVEELCRRAGLTLDEYTWSASPTVPSTAIATDTTSSGQIRSGIPMRTPSEPKTKDTSKPSELSAPDNPGPPKTSKSTSTKKSEKDNDLQESSTNISTTTIKVSSDIDAEWRWRFTKTSTLT